VEGRITKVEVHFGMTHNLGDFHSARVDAGMSVEVPPGKDARIVFKEAFKEVEMQVVTRIKELADRR
jgi:hypothetical protein